MGVGVGLSEGRGQRESPPPTFNFFLNSKARVSEGTSSVRAVVAVSRKQLSGVVTGGVWRLAHVKLAHRDRHRFRYSRYSPRSVDLLPVHELTHFGPVRVTSYLIFKFSLSGRSG